MKNIILAKKNIMNNNAIQCLNRLVMILYFKKRKFRNHIRKCGILKDEKIRTKCWFGDLYYIKRGLEEWEQDILNEEINRVERKKEKRKKEREMKENRKVFFDKWKND